MAWLWWSAYVVAVVTVFLGFARLVVVEYRENGESLDGEDIGLMLFLSVVTPIGLIMLVTLCFQRLDGTPRQWTRGKTSWTWLEDLVAPKRDQ